MQTVTRYPAGMPSWVDLSTSDVDAAKRFYAALLGWDYVDQPAGPDQTYAMAQIGGHDVAGMFFGAGPEHGPPRWNSYVTVGDVDASAARAAELGGLLVAEPFEVMQAGRMAVVQAPDASVLALWQPRENIGAALVNVPGAFCWTELNSVDLDAARPFYQGLFGWELQAEPGGPGGEYISIQLDGRSIGGMQAQPAPGAPSAWLVYFTVEDCDAAAAQVPALGGQVHLAPMDIPDVGRMCLIADPQGAVCCLIALLHSDPPPG